MYVKTGLQGTTSGDSVIQTVAQCNDNGIPLSGGYSIVKEDEGGSGEIEEIESIPNLQNKSWMVNVEGEDIEVTPYVVCLNTAQ